MENIQTISKEQVIEELFAVAEHIASNVMLRGSPDTIKRRLFEVTNKVTAQVNPKPDWFPEAAKLRDSLVEMLLTQLKGHQLGKRFPYLPDSLSVARGKIPAHLEAWNKEWEEKFIPALKAHKEVYLTGY